MKTFSSIHFSLNIALATSHIFWYYVFLLSFSSMCFQIFFEISPLTQDLFRVLFTFCMYRVSCCLSTINFYFETVVVVEHTLGMILGEFDFFAQDRVYLGEISKGAWEKMCILLLIGGLFRVSVTSYFVCCSDLI